jgi:hypothetical protein
VAVPGSASGSAEPRRMVDARGLWAGGAATAAVAALTAVVGVLLVEGVLGVSMTPPPLVPVGQSLALRYAVTAAVLALAATGLAHLLALTTPRPRSFLSWIVGLATVVGVALPLAAPGAPGGRVLTALVDLVIGLCVLSLLQSVLARTAGRVPTRRRFPPPGGPGDPRYPAM